MSEVHAGILFGIYSRILSGIYSDILSGILSEYVPAQTEPELATGLRPMRALTELEIVIGFGSVCAQAAMELAVRF